jgi:hypothetical protein
LAGLLVWETGTADTTLCIHKKTGRVRAVPTGACKGREEAVKVADPAAQSVGAIQVYDANNQYLGLLTGSANPYGITNIYVPSLHASFAVQPVGDGTTGDFSGSQDWIDRSHRFATDDCSGPAYIIGFTGKIIKSDQGFILYENAIQQIQVKAIRGMSKGQQGPCQQVPTIYTTYAIEDTPSPVTLPFSVPVALPLQFRN